MQKSGNMNTEVEDLRTKYNIQQSINLSEYRVANTQRSNIRTVTFSQGTLIYSRQDIFVTVRQLYKQHSGNHSHNSLETFSQQSVNNLTTVWKQSHNSLETISQQSGNNLTTVWKQSHKSQGIPEVR
jgi:4-diphosphocytidyl-2C-methyl-D-erythritol kinase